MMTYTYFQTNAAVIALFFQATACNTVCVFICTFMCGVIINSKERESNKKKNFLIFSFE